MRLYYEIAIRSLRRTSMYRAAFVAGTLTNAFFGAVRCFVYIALYGNGGSVAGFTLHDAISYTWLTQALISVGAGWIMRDVATTIRSGDVVTDLIRPWNFYGYWFSRSMGERVFNLLLRGSFTYLAGVMFFDAAIPSLPAFLAFASAILLALPIIFAYNFMVNLSAFWLVDDAGVWLIGSVVLSFFSGFLIPLNFFPPAIAAIAHLLPFQAITSVPAQIFLGQIQGTALWQAFGLQIFWALVLTGSALLVLQVAVRKVVVQGG